MKSKNIFYYLIIFISINIHSQKIYKKYGDREYSDTLNVKLLHKVCDNLGIKFSDVYTNKTKSAIYNSNNTFFVIQYVIKKTKDENEYTTKYLFADSRTGNVIDHIDNKETYYDNEALQPSSTRIFKNKVKLNENTLGISVITEFYLKSCATIFSEQKISMFSLSNNKINELLSNYVIRKTSGESNCQGNYMIEKLIASMDISKEKTNDFYNINITKKYIYEEIHEQGDDETEKKPDLIKNKTEVEILKFDDNNYPFKIDNTFRYLYK